MEGGRNSKRGMFSGFVRYVMYSISRSRFVIRRLRTET